MVRPISTLDSVHDDGHTQHHITILPYPIIHFLRIHLRAEPQRIQFKLHHATDGRADIVYSFEMEYCVHAEGICCQGRELGARLLCSAYDLLTNDRTRQRRPLLRPG